MDVESGYRRTESGFIPKDWVVIDLSHLCTLQRGFDITQATSVPGTVPVYSSSGVAYFHNKAMAFPPGVVTGRKGILGRVFVIDEPYWPHDTTLWIKDFKGNYPRFVALVLKNFHLERLDAATSVPTLNRNNLVGHEIPLPPTKAEQEAIAEAIGDADSFIESLEQLIAKKHYLKRGTMQELLSGKRRLPGFTGEWEVKRLGDLASLYQPTTISARQFKGSGYPVYGANGIVGFYDQMNHDTWQVTVTCRGSTCGTVNRTVNQCWITGNAMVLNCDHNTEISKDFFYHLLCDQDLSGCITGTGQPQIVRSPLAAVEVIIPPTIEEQTAIAAVFSDMDAEVTALGAKLVKARNIKQGMMQELLTGRSRLI